MVIILILRKDIFVFIIHIYNIFTHLLIYFYRKCPSDLIVFLTQRIINNLRVKWTVEPEKFGYRNEKQGL